MSFNQTYILKGRKCFNPLYAAKIYSIDMHSLELTDFKQIINIIALLLQFCQIFPVSAVKFPFYTRLQTREY